MTEEHRCPECGTTTYRGDGYITTAFTAKWAILDKCETCERHSREQMEKDGAEAAERHNAEVLERMFGTEAEAVNQ